MKTIGRFVIAISVLTAVVAAHQKPPQKPTPQKSAVPAPRPNFSGTWVITSPADAAGQEQIVAQTATSFTVEVVGAKGGHKMSYQLDGVERRMAIPGRSADITMLAKAAWDGNRIVVTTNTSYSNGMKTTSTDIWSIDAQGRLVMDSTEKGPTGPGPTVKLIHVRKK